MKILTFLFTVLISAFLFHCASAQDFAVTHRGDTVRGKIRISNYGTDRKVQVNTADKKKVVIPIFQVKSLTLDNEVFHPVKGSAGYEFMKVLKEGYLSLYAFQLQNQSTYDGMLLTKKDGTTLEVPNLNFRKAMKKFLEECPGTTSKIEEGTLTKRELPLIVDHYNECISKNSTAVAKAEQPVLPQASEAGSSQESKNVASPSWANLEERVKSLDDFDGRVDALDMIAEIKAKLGRGEKVPNFLVEGLKGVLKDKGVDEVLNAALAEIR